MSLKSGRIVLSMLTLNSLLQTYENQPVEFYDSNLMIQHPKFTSFYNANQMINLLAGISLIFFSDWKNIFNTFTSIIFGISVILQNINFYLPKTLNMIEIYLQTFLILYQIIVFFTTQYVQMKEQQKINYIYPDNRRIINQKKQSLNLQQRKNFRKNNYNIEKPKIVEKLSNSGEQLQMKETNCQNNSIEEKQQEKFPEKKIEVDVPQNQIQIKQENQSETEMETEIQNEINHWDLSEISSTKSEKNLSILIKSNNNQQSFYCNFDSFDSISNIFNSIYTEKQITDIKIHILLNLFDENEDCTLKLWCYKKLLQINANT